MRLKLTVGLLLMSLASCASTPQPTQKLISTVPTATPYASPERDAALASVTAAIQRHDYRQAIAVETAWAQRHPLDLDFRHFEPVIFLLAGDRAGWEHARGELLETWRRMKSTATPPANPSFTVDLIKVGSALIIADQCYERAGRFGVIYRFTIVNADHRISSFFTVESPDSDNKIARELGQAAQVFSLDHFRPGVHETVAMLPGLPAYTDLRQRVLEYVAHPQPLSASSNGQSGLSTEGCAISRASSNS